MNWQPIETIPRNQSVVLVCMPGATDYFYVVAWEDDAEDDIDGLQWRCPRTGQVLLTDAQMAACHLPPMWCAITHPPSSLAAGQLA